MATSGDLQRLYDDFRADAAGISHGDGDERSISACRLPLLHFRYCQGDVRGFDLFQQQPPPAGGQNCGRLCDTGDADRLQGMLRWRRGEDDPVQLIAFKAAQRDAEPLGKFYQAGFITLGRYRGDAADTFQ